MREGKLSVWCWPIGLGMPSSSGKDAGTTMESDQKVETAIPSLLLLSMRKLPEEEDSLSKPAGREDKGIT